jgi:hypothetical protein
MPKLSEICRHVRSKNAGPFWVTVDLFFDSAETYRRYHASPSLGPDLFARLYGTDPRHVKAVSVDDLKVVKISYPRPQPQGWMGERDMHCGQQFARLLDIEVE